MNTTLVGFEPIASRVCIPIFLRRNLILLLRHTQLIFAVFTMLHHFCLSSVNSINLFTVCFPFDRSYFMPMVAKSCLTVCIHAVFGLPCGCFTFLRYSSRAFLLVFLDLITSDVLAMLVCVPLFFCSIVHISFWNRACCL